MRRNPGYASAVVLILSLGIGLNAAMYGLLSRLRGTPLRRRPRGARRYRHHRRRRLRDRRRDAARLLGPRSGRHGRVAAAADRGAERLREMARVQSLVARPAGSPCARGHGRGRGGGDRPVARGARRLAPEGPRGRRRAGSPPEDPRTRCPGRRHAAAAGRRRRRPGGASHRGRERVEPADAARRRPPARAGRAPRPRRGPVGRRTPAGDRERRARRGLRGGGAGRGRGDRPAAAGHAASGPSVGARSLRLHRDRVHRRHGARGRFRGGDCCRPCTPRGAGT